MTLDRILIDFRSDPQFMANVAAWQTIHAAPARTQPIPATLHPLLHQGLHKRGIDALYLHQAQAVDAAHDGRHIVVVTPTASGKTLCYNLPVLDNILRDEQARALYLFPTKALAQDQLSELHAWNDTLTRLTGSSATEFHVSTYDGDTPSSVRSRIRNSVRVMLTNPDMLHTGILPYHGNWEIFFSNLNYVVLDEMHTYRGVFGSHVANVIRRLRRICSFYGSRPQFICTSATIANPVELAGRLLEEPVTLVDENGAPRGEKSIILYNPPVYDPERGLRESSTLVSQELASRCVIGGAQTIVFSRSRLVTELLLSYMRERVARSWETDTAESIRGYRGGYLPLERRGIEAGLRSGDVRAVVATNALELGIDIGQLQAAVLCGYPGNIASTWQQMGRAGRSTESSLAILVATGGALDQYVIRHPEFIFERSPEHALINSDNLMMLVDHMRCAAFELPFAEDSAFGRSPYSADVLRLLEEEGDVVAQAGRYFWSGLAYPARQVSLRSSSADSVTIQANYDSFSDHGGSADNEVVFENTNNQARSRVIGEIDMPSVPLLVHEGAIYMHEGQAYSVNRLDMEECVAHVTPVDVDYYTSIIGETKIDVLNEHETRDYSGCTVSYGDLRVSTQVLGYRRIKRFTHETLGVFPVEHPPQVLETTGYWCTISQETQSMLEQAGQWRDSLNDYGPNWEEQRQRVRERDGYRCTKCGQPEPPGRQHDVHHRIPFRVFGYVPGLNDHYKQANRLDNLELVCRTCHHRLEASVRTRGGLDGLGYALHNLAPLYLMCDWKDIDVHIVRADASATVREENAKTGIRPAIYLYERTYAGLGFSQRLFQLHETLLDAAAELIDDCACPNGCPACVGPVLENEDAYLETKSLTKALLRVLRDGE